MTKQYGLWSGNHERMYVFGYCLLFGFFSRRGLLTILRDKTRIAGGKFCVNSLILTKNINYVSITIIQ